LWSLLSKLKMDSNNGHYQSLVKDTCYTIYEAPQVYRKFFNTTRSMKVNF